MTTRARSKLNVKQVASLSKVGLYADGGGLYLRIRKSGRSWFFIGTVNGQRVERGLGSALDITLAKAREKATEARLLALEGIDVKTVRRSARNNDAAVTFGTFANKHIDKLESGFRNPKNAQQWRNTLSTHAATIMDLPIRDIDRDHLIAVLEPIWISKAETASRVRARIERILDAAEAEGLRTGKNPAIGRGGLHISLPQRPKVAVKHHAALPFAEIKPFMLALRSRSAMAARALEFTILTAARSGETRGMTWGEVDLTSKVWTVPANRMKANKVHQVPLSDAAISILLKVKSKRTSSDQIVFVAQRGGSLSDMALSQLLKRMEYASITVHGFRSTFRDWAGDMTQFRREDIELALAHTIGSSTERAYRRNTALEKRREAMAAWAAYCTTTDDTPPSTIKTR